jgi:hypothetical protein
MAGACRASDLFRPISLSALKSKLNQVRQLPIGTEDGDDKTYENLMVRMLPSLLYSPPRVREGQVRTESGAHIRDLIFHNATTDEFTRLLRNEHGNV